MKRINNRMAALTLFAAGALAAATSANAVGWPANYEGVMLQGFYWDSYSDSKWTKLTSQADELSQYFKLIWVPNSAKSSGSPTMGYMPIYWFTHHNCSFGTEEQLREMISTYKEKGVGIIADCVINHRVGVSGWGDFPSEEWNGQTWHIGPEGVCSTDEWKNNGGNPTGAADTGAATPACATTTQLIRCLISYWRNVPPEMRKSSEQYAALTAQISAAAQRLASADTTTTDTTALIADLTIVHDSVVMLKTHSLSRLYEQKFKDIIQHLAQHPEPFSPNDLASLFEASEVGYDIARQTPIYQAITSRAANDNNTPAQSLTMLSYIASYISRANIETAIARTFSNTKGNTAQAL